MASGYMMKKILTTAVSVVALIAVPSQAWAADGPTAPSTSKASAVVQTSNTGMLRGGEWKKVVWGFGWYSANYSVSIFTDNYYRPDGEFECYTSGVKTSSGVIPAHGAHRMSLEVRPYGECWVLSPVDAHYVINPLK